MSGVSFVFLGALGFLLSWLSIPLIQRHLQPSSRRQMHHTHTGVISRFGGLSLAIAFVGAGLVAFLYYPTTVGQNSDNLVILCASLAMFLLGFVDDIIPLGAKKKLAGQILIASCVYFAGIHIGNLRNPLTGSDYPLGVFSYVATVFWLVAFTNLINLIDGVDGLAGGISLMVMVLLTCVGMHGEASFPIIAAVMMCGALVGFLCYNFPPARIYLGDGGAYFLGFLIGILSMVHSHKGTVAAALIAPLFALALPIVDVSIAILRRGLKGIPVFRPDRRHIHHRLAEAGLSRTRIVLLFYGCSALFLMLAFAVFLSKGRYFPAMFGLGCMILLMSAGCFSFSREWFAVGKVVGNSLETRKQTRYALALGAWFEMEVDRCSTAESMWEDFKFIARKLGFATVTLWTPEGRHEWKRDASIQKAEMAHRRRFDLPHVFAMEITADEKVLTNVNFEFLSELAAEMWLRNVQRWEKLNRAALKFRTGLPDVPVSAVPEEEATAPGVPANLAWSMGAGTND